MNYRFVAGVANAAALSLSLMSPLAAFAKEPPGEIEALRAEQEQLFQEMYASPADIELMFRYALVSIRLEDFEAAIGTLERILIYDPNQPRVRTELAASYFRVGSYPIARQYFSEVAEDPNAPPELKARVAAFIAEIDKRTRTSYFAGTVGVGGIFTTNANNGPNSRNIEFLGLPALLTDPNATSQTDGGAMAQAQVSHFYDLGSPLGDQWRSDFTFYSARYFDTDEGATDLFLLRTGPRLSLDSERYGLKGRPYVELDYVRYANDSLYATAGLGFELSQAVSPRLTAFSDLRVGWRANFDDGANDRDGLNMRARGGVNYIYDERFSFLGYGLLDYEGADTKSERNFAVGAGGVTTVSYDPELEIAGGRWSFDLGARAVYRRYDRPGLFNPAKQRDDLDLRFSLGHNAPLDDGFEIFTRAEYFDRNSNIRTFDLDSFTVTAGVQYRF